MTGLYRFAEKNIRIISLFDEVHTLCTAYRAEGAADFTAEITPDDLLRERAASARADQAEGRSIRNFKDSYLETLAVYRKIAEWMPLQGTLLLHGSAVAVDGRAYLFSAKSGTGKSTHAALWLRRFGERAVILNDDKPFVRLTADGAEVFGTPWDGKHHRSANTHAPLQAVCLLSRAAETTLTPLPPQTALPRLMQQVYRPADPAALAATIRLLDRLTASVPLYAMGCNMEPQAAQIAYDAMRR